MSNSVRKAFQIVEYVAERQGAVRQIDIINEFKMNKTTAHRYFDILEELSILEKKDKNYYLGMGLLRLGNKVQSQNLIIERVKPYLERIVSELNETANLAQFTNDRMTYIYKVESSRNLQFNAEPGDDLPFHCTALGKAILSILPDEKVDELLTRDKLKEYTESTIVNVKKLKKEIQGIRTNGYAMEVGEFEEGLICISIPLHFQKYNFFGALSFSGTTNRLDKEKMLAIAERVKPVVERMKQSIEN